MNTLKYLCLILTTVLASVVVSVTKSDAQTIEIETLHTQATELYRAGRYAEAIPLAERVLAIRKKFLGPNHPDVALSLNNLALLYKMQGRYVEAEPLYKGALAAYENVFGPAHAHVAAALNNLAGLYDSLDRPSDAEPLYRRALVIYEKALGPEHRNVTTALNNLALHYYVQDRYADAITLVRRTLNMRSAEKTIALPVLFQSARANVMTAPDAFNDSFDLVQRVGSSAAANTLSKLAGRFATGPDKELADLIRKDLGLAAEAERLDKAIFAAVAKPSSERNAVAEDQVRKRIDAIKLDRDKLRQAVDLRFPDYVALSKPQPLSLAETQALLADDEALVVFDFDTRSYAWIVTRTSSDWVELYISASTLEAHVRDLRGSVKAEGNAFDVHLARWIYRETFEIFADKIEKKTRLSVVTSGALTSLPLNLLITKDPGSKEYKDIDWLARSHAITIWPSIANIKVLRDKSMVSSASKPLIAFADPIFSRPGRKGSSDKAPSDSVSMRSITDFYRGSQLDYDELIAALRQLPASRKEVETVAKRLDAELNNIRLGADTTKVAVKKARLDQYRIVYFATHCLAAGQLDNFVSTKAEPALALTTPDKRTESDDGLLYASEIAQLNLNADWVVLSACDTAAEDDPGALALFGLARAFFYAGGRSLLVSHWAVKDQQIASLMSNTFQESARDERLTHAQALQRSILELLNAAKSNDEAHPRLWASFVVMGEPAVDESDICYSESGDTAITSCGRLIISGRYHARKLAGLHRYRGAEYRKKGRYDRAIADLTEAVRLEPKFAQAFKNRGDAYRDMGENDGAIVDYSQAIVLDPNDATTFNDRGDAFSIKGEYDLAISDYNAALKLDPNLAGSLYGRGIAKQGKGDATGGEVDIAAAKRIQADIAEVSTRKGVRADESTMSIQVSPSTAPDMSAGKILPDEGKANRID